MVKSTLSCAAAVGTFVLAAGGASAVDKKYTFALVPKNTNNPFFDQALDGCRKAEKELGGSVQCLYIGPGEHGGGDEQAQIVADLITKRVDGIAVSPANAAAMANALAGAKAAHIPILAWDSDLLKEGLATGNVGQRPFEMGYKAMYFLKDIKDGKAPPQDPIYIGLDVCTPKTAATCIGGGS